ncbi:hypothetical protein [Pontibacter mangrovi]|uniref:STAS/SEC14 domain-containing protein n=1 Tax=Pontibacter mangrovi TaxID=2589816 RepID=A0A501WBP8_9BACT|nr:hypothetical protein [Pontibacter mangrovi]TPE45810.1 hypothetical protein FJM65_00225 [Pontibacter mangrovi]
MLVLQKEYATVEVEPGLSLLKLTWLRQPTDEEFKQAFSKSLEECLEHGLRLFLSINSAGISMDVGLQRWASAFGADFLKRLRLERYARVIPSDAMQELITLKMFDQVQELRPGQIDLRTFYSPDTAFKWLTSGA